MDFDKFDARAAATAGAFLHLKHPSTGELIWADPVAKGGADSQPCRVQMIGLESPQAQAALREIQKRKMTAVKKKDGEETRFFTDLHAELVEAVKPLIIGFENIDRGKTPAGLADVEWFLNLQTLNGSETEISFAEQISNFARKRSNFLGNV
jgi:hypothetical protein